MRVVGQSGHARCESVYVLALRLWFPFRLMIILWIMVFHRAHDLLCLYGFPFSLCFSYGFILLLCSLGSAYMVI
jgi:hypothetical protein